MGLLHSNTRQKQCQAPLLEKKINKNDKQPYWTGVIGGVIIPNDKAAEAKPLCQDDFKEIC